MHPGGLLHKWQIAFMLTQREAQRLGHFAFFLRGIIGRSVHLSLQKY